MMMYFLIETHVGGVIFYYKRKKTLLGILTKEYFLSERTPGYKITSVWPQSCPLPSKSREGDSRSKWAILYNKVFKSLPIWLKPKFCFLKNFLIYQKACFSDMLSPRKEPITPSVIYMFELTSQLLFLNPCAHTCLYTKARGLGWPRLPSVLLPVNQPVSTPSRRVGRAQRNP